MNKLAKLLHQRIELAKAVQPMHFNAVLTVQTVVGVLLPSVSTDLCSRRFTFDTSHDLVTPEDGHVYPHLFRPMQ